MAAAYSRRMTGGNNPNFKELPPKICLFCAKQFQTYQANRKYCSRRCYGDHAATEEAKKLRSPYRGGNKDRNHNALVKVFEDLGCSVIETYTMGGGFPDLVLGFVGLTFLVEIKNPETSYGRRGLTESQRKMADSWRGGPVTVISTETEAIEFVQRMRAKQARI